MKYQFPVLSPHAYSPSLAPSPPCNVDYNYRLPDAGDIYALCIRTFCPAPSPPYPPERLLLQSNRFGRPDKTSKTTLLGARGATPAFPSSPASHRSLLIQTACVRRYRKKNATLTKKINYIEKKIFARQTCAPVDNG